MQDKYTKHREEVNPTVELFHPRRLVIDVDTLDITLHLTNKELGNGALSFGALGKVSPCTSPNMMIYLHLGF